MTRYSYLINKSSCHLNINTALLTDNNYFYERHFNNSYIVKWNLSTKILCRYMTYYVKEAWDLVLVLNMLQVNKYNVISQSEYWHSSQRNSEIVIWLVFISKKWIVLKSILFEYFLTTKKQNKENALHDQQTRNKRFIRITVIVNYCIQIERTVWITNIIADFQNDE